MLNIQLHKTKQRFLGSTVSGDKDRSILCNTFSQTTSICCYCPENPPTVVVKTTPQTPISYLQLSMLWARYFTGHMFQTFLEFNISSCTI